MTLNPFLEDIFRVPVTILASHNDQRYLGTLYTAQKPQRSLSTPQTCYDLLQGHDGADPLPLENWRAAKPNRDIGLAVWFLVAAQLQPNHQPPIPDVGAFCQSNIALMDAQWP